MNLRNKLIVTIIVALVCLFIVPMQSEGVQASTKVSINKKETTIWVKNYVDLSITGTKKKITWTSSNSKIAKVSISGRVWGVREGQATITATIAQKKYTCKITVKKEKDNSCLTDFLQKMVKKEKANEKNSLIGNYSYLMGYRWIDINQDGLEELCIYEIIGLEVKTIVLAAKNGKVVKAGEISQSFDWYNSKYK